jgi:hypothetical protein
VSAAVSAAVAAAVVLLVWASVAGPAEIIGPSSKGAGRHQPPTANAPASQAHHHLRPPRGLPPADSHHGGLSWVGTLIIWAVELSVVVAACLLVVWLWRHRWRPPEKPDEEEFEVLPDVHEVSGAITRDAGLQLAAIQEGSPRNGIVRCWLRLEDIIADAGMPRAPWETSAEFTVRVLKALDVDPRAIGSLARLYREARFSDHRLDETSRAAARSALEQLHRDLEVARPTERGRSR